MNRDIDLASCNYIKCILMLAVVLCHSCAFWGGGWFSAVTPSVIVPPLGWLSSWLGTFHVSGFVLVSGYLYYYLRYEAGKYRDIKIFFLNKFKRLIIPYIFVSLVWVIPFAVYFYHYSISDLFVNYVLGASPSQLWFLLMLFGVFVIIYPLSNFLARSRVITVIGLAAISYMLGYVVSYISKGVFQIGTSFSYVPYFLIGFLFRKYWADINSKKLVAVAMGGGLLNILLFLFLHGIIVQPVTGMIATFITLLCKLSGTIGVFCFLLVLFRNLRSISLLERLSDYSFPIYLFHQQVIYLVICQIDKSSQPVVTACCCFFLSIAVSSCLTGILMQNKITNTLLGCKKV